MRFITGLECIIIYFAISLILFYVCSHKYNCVIGNSNNSNGYSGHKMAIYQIILFALLYTLVNVFATTHSFSSRIGNDRFNYLQDFNGRKQPYIGMKLFYDLIHLFTDDFYIVLYSTSFICCILYFFSYRISNETTPKSLSIFLCTNFFFSTFGGLKQSLAAALIAVSFALIFRNKNRMDKWEGLAFILVACLYHTTSYIMIPIYFFLIKKDRKKPFSLLFIILIAALFIEPLSMRLATITAPYLPTLSNKLIEYFGETSYHQEGGLSVVKGIPYYMIFFFGSIRRNQLCKKVDGYDKYLVISGIAAIAYALTLVSYWLMRMVSIFFFPLSIFLYIIISNEKNQKYKLFELIIPLIMAFFTIRENILVFVNFGGY